MVFLRLLPVVGVLFVHVTHGRLSGAGMNSDVEARCPSDFDLRDLGRCHGSIFGISHGREVVDMSVDPGPKQKKKNSVLAQ